VTKIFEIRGKKVMLDRDLAQLYGVPVKVFNQAVKRNIKRFPEDFMYQLTWQEAVNLRSLPVTSGSRSQIVTLKQGQNIKYLPYVFTEQGVAMLSSVLNSERAIQVNIMIMRAFVALKELLLTHKDLAEKIEELEKKYSSHDKKIKVVFEAIKQLVELHRNDRVITGFKVGK
jgi:hypothetical protein